MDQKIAEVESTKLKEMLGKTPVGDVNSARLKSMISGLNVDKK
jgi:hypothetical protein